MAKIVRTISYLSELEILTFFCLQNIISFHNVKHADGCSEHNRYQMKWVVLFLSTFNFNIWYVHLLKQLQQHISQYISTLTSTLMLSHAFCNSSQRLSFECTIDLSSLFSNSPQICSMALRSGLWGASPSFSMFQQIPSVAGSSGNSSVYGYCNG